MSDSPEYVIAPIKAPVFKTNRFWRAIPAGMRRRWWMFRAFDLIARFWPMFKKRRGLAVVRMDGIGDMVLFRNSLDHYVETFDVEPSEITVIGCDSWSGLVEEIFRGYKVIPINEHRYAKKPLYRFSVNLKMRRLAPKTVVSDAYFRRALMADSLVWVMAPAKSFVSHPYINDPTRSEFTYYMSTVDEIVDTGPYPTHELTRHARFVSHIAGKTIVPKAPQLNWPDRSDKELISGQYVLLNPGSNEYGRRWPLEKYLKLAGWIKDLGGKAVFVGKADERAGGDAIKDISDGDKIIDLTGKTSVPDLLDLMKKAALVVTNDTGPAHLSIGLGAPTVVIIGGGHFGSFVPYPDEATPDNVRFVYEKMDCYHCFWRCHKRDDKFQSFPCVASVKPETVKDACFAVFPNLRKSVL
jgi:ADP-heptose:LPS heptosyltransferase